MQDNSSSQPPEARLAEADGVLMGGEGRSADPIAARGLYLAAAEAGSGAAAERLAVMSAIGVAQQADWGAALDWLARAAQLDWRPAQKQLVTLADRKDLAGRTLPATAWGKVRAEIDLAALLTPPVLKQRSLAPAVFVLEKLASRAMCRWMIDRARGRLRAGQVHHVTTGQMEADPMRTAEAAHFRLNETDLVLTLVQERLARAARLVVHSHEPPNVLHYSVGQEYRAHFDFINPAVPAFQEHLAVLGQRVATLLVYLNEDFEGGETSFARMGWKHRGRAGDGLLFFNVTPQGQPDALTLHAGLPPTRGEKWLLSLWIRDRVQPIL